MNRLTVRYSGIHVGYKSKHNNSVLCSEMTVPQIRECMEKLAAYEDTGLTPEEVYKTIKAGVPEWIPKYLEYRKLEEQERLIKLPCKVGDTVYAINCNEIIESTVTEITLNEKGVRYIRLYSTDDRLADFKYDYFKKTVSLTREEAEKALEEMNENK